MAMAKLKLSKSKLHEGQKTLFINDMKKNEIWLRPKVWVQKIFLTLKPNYVKGFNERRHKFCSILNGQIINVSKMEPRVNIMLKMPNYSTLVGQLLRFVPAQNWEMRNFENFLA